MRPSEKARAVGIVAGSLTPCPNSIEASRPVLISTWDREPYAALKKVTAESKARASPFQRRLTAIVMRQIPPIATPSEMGPNEPRRWAFVHTIARAGAATRPAIQSTGGWMSDA